MVDSLDVQWHHGLSQTSSLPAMDELTREWEAGPAKTTSYLSVFVISSHISLAVDF